MELFYRVVMLLFAVVIDVPAFYEVKIIQRFHEQPRNQTVTVGDNVKLVCIVENQIGTVQWIKNGLGLGDLSKYPSYAMTGFGTDFSLLITNVTEEDEGTYNCQVLPKTESSKLSNALRSVDAYLTVAKALPLTLIALSNFNFGLIVVLAVTVTVTVGIYHRYRCIRWERLGHFETVDGIISTARQPHNENKGVKVTAEGLPGSSGDQGSENRLSDQDKETDDNRNQHIIDIELCIQEDLEAEIIWFDA